MFSLSGGIGGVGGRTAAVGHGLVLTAGVAGWQGKGGRRLFGSKNIFDVQRDRQKYSKRYIRRILQPEGKTAVVSCACSFSTRSGGVFWGIMGVERGYAVVDLLLDSCNTPLRAELKKNTVPVARLLQFLPVSGSG